MSESNRSGGTHTPTVGYKRPPVNRQFKPGQSGNPKGRPKGRKNFKTLFVESLNKKVKVRDKNRTRMVSKLQVMIDVMMNKAMAGDLPAFAKIVQTAERLDAFNYQPEPTIDTSGYDLIVSKLEEMGYNFRPTAKWAAEEETTRSNLQQPRSSR
jgi:Family of unknown function (DUF5681)